MRNLFVVLCLALCPALLPAADQQITFALPDLEGRISLGLFDSQGKLVRALAVDKTEADFKIGLNGLITTWDGLDDDGNPLPSGKYVMRGFVVGARLKAEGEAYHFNDWVEDDQSPRLIRIEDFTRLSDGYLVLAKVLRSFEMALSVDAEGQPRWRTSLLSGERVRSWSGSSGSTRFPVNGPKPTGGSAVLRIVQMPSLFSPMVTATGEYAVALTGRKFHVLRVNDGSIVNSEEHFGPSPQALAADASGVLVSAAGDLVRIDLPDLKMGTQEKAPASFSSLAIEPSRRIGAAARQSQVWLAAGSDWEKLETGILPTSVSLGANGTFWVTGKAADDGEVLAGQFDTKGEFLRAYHAEGFDPMKIVASGQTEEIAVLEQQGETQRLRVLKFVGKKDEGTSDWEIIFEKSLTACTDFGLVDGKLVANAGGNASNPTFKVTLATGGLTASAPTLVVKVTLHQGGLWLATGDGLPIKQLVPPNGVRRVVSTSGPTSGSRRIYAGDGAVVAEYLVTGLGDIAEIEAGEIEIP